MFNILSTDFEIHSVGQPALIYIIILFQVHLRQQNSTYIGRVAVVVDVHRHLLYPGLTLETPPPCREPWRSKGVTEGPGGPRCLTLLVLQPPFPLGLFRSRRVDLRAKAEVFQFQKSSDFCLILAVSGLN